MGKKKDITVVTYRKSDGSKAITAVTSATAAAPDQDPQVK